MIVIALDPGITTGIALAEIDHELIEVDYWQKEWRCLDLWRYLNMAQPEHLVCESFEYRPKKTVGVELYPRNLIGIAQLYSESAERPLHMQSASQGKSYYSDFKLKEMELYRKGVDHGRDAMRHLLQWLTFGPGYKYYTRDAEIKFR